MNPTRRSVIAAGAAGVAALAAGCSGGGSGTGTVAGDGNLRISVWTANKDHLALLNSIGAAFKADRPEVRSVTFESLNPADYTTALTTQLASGNPPDLGWILETNAADFIEAETLVDMAPDMKADGDYRYNDLEPALLNQ
ncbi:extracellular solute-binding protein [Streptomyces sp. PKU-EA00015]|uniref:extracellular solute-binding protein n=1 Tax=Streptomyces sp. PKU-EA00015 TaxID=2748326 RepID=UPI0015A4DC0B|nr:extracellular solute-binding protein [Streptomyces sp. PKU-EA00015]NWF25565.1 extracellular solute-binding protein [Streptomyces sp. PKU-EA00015]